MCQAAETQDAPVMVDTGVKHGVAKQTFQRGSPHKVDRIGVQDWNAYAAYALRANKAGLAASHLGLTCKSGA